MLQDGVLDRSERSDVTVAPNDESPIWTTSDCLGRPIELSHWAWESHITRRPYLAGCQSLLKQIVEQPDAVIRDANGADHYYALGVMRAPYSRMYLHIIASDQRGRMQVKTFWAAKAMDAGEIVWIRPRQS